MIMTAAIERDESADLMALGNRLREARIQAGMTQKELADRLGWPNVTISNYERGQINFGISSIYKLAEALEVAPSELVDPQKSR